jgi:hypothetical protein
MSCSIVSFDGAPALVVCAAAAPASSATAGSESNREVCIPQRYREVRVDSTAREIAVACCYRSTRVRTAITPAAHVQYEPRALLAAIAVT